MVCVNSGFPLERLSSEEGTAMRQLFEFIGGLLGSCEPTLYTISAIPGNTCPCPERQLKD